MRADRVRVLLAVLLPLALLPLLGTGGAAAEGPMTTPRRSAPPLRSSAQRRGDPGVSVDQRFTASDGVSLATTLTGRAPMAPRPTVVEFSPYGRNSQTLSVGPEYNYLLVQDRGTGDSDGRFDALGPRSQQDVHEVLQWACHQPWSNGDLALNGFSASAIIVYNSLHERLPCVKAAILKSGTFELYRDLLVPGGINNILPGAGVLALIGAPALMQGGDRLQRNPSSALDVAGGLLTAGLDDLKHPTQDSWWRQRGFRGDVNHLPILMVDGFFDVESRGAFQAYQALKGDGAHLLVVGGHDGAPAGTDDGVAQAHAWLDHYVRGVDNGVTRRPRVQALLSDGARESYLAGDFVRYAAPDWPVPGTRWTALHLSPARSGTAHSLNDGSLTLGTPGRIVTQRYPALPSDPFATDVPNAAIVGASGVNRLSSQLPRLTEMDTAEADGLSFTTATLRHHVLAAGPLDLDLRLSSTAPSTHIWAVLSDVSPDGHAHPLTVGRLNTSFPRVVADRSLYSGGRLVQPYGDFGTRDDAALGRARQYHVELWPVGNRFRAGDRIRLDIVGASAASLPGVPALDSVVVGGRQGGVLRFPVLPGSDLATALP
ncbi:MAG: CocE/NonD family hydrolase [Marmoricola sp.]